MIGSHAFTGAPIHTHFEYSSFTLVLHYTSLLLFTLLMVLLNITRNISFQIDANSGYWTDVFDFACAWPDFVC